MTDAEFRDEFWRVSRMATDRNVTTPAALAAIEAFGRLDYRPKEKVDQAVMALRLSMDWRHESGVPAA